MNGHFGWDVHGDGHVFFFQFQGELGDDAVNDGGEVERRRVDHS